MHASIPLGSTIDGDTMDFRFQTSGNLFGFSHNFIGHAIGLNSISFELVQLSKLSRRLKLPLLLCQIHCTLVSPSSIGPLSLNGLATILESHFFVADHFVLLQKGIHSSG
mmetsp:Transcript_13191/g.38000  ORF Transcript_13191/g.38000 Transcript_13191/m.38000 type:complete len:110 (-) Transcript_13191:1376-1705(-)